MKNASGGLKGGKLMHAGLPLLNQKWQGIECIARRAFPVVGKETIFHVVYAIML
jgi:hypothetical protein